jgi:hypothetical protein
VSETLKKVNLDAALREWPDVEKPEADWEALTHRIEDRLRSSRPGASVAAVPDENLFAAPLGQTAEDGHNSAAPLSIARSTGPVLESRAEDKPMTMQDRERDRRSLQDLAKMAQMTPPPPSMKSPPSGVLRASEAKKDDSGIVDLAMAAQSDPGAAQRAQSTPLAQSGLFDDEPASVKPGPVSMPLSQPAPSFAPPPSVSAPASGRLSAAPVSAAPVSAAPASAAAVPSAPLSMPSTAAAVQAQPKKGKGSVVVGLFTAVVVLGAAAAGGFLFLKHRANQAMTAAVKTEAPAAQPTAAPPPATTNVADNTPPPAEAAPSEGTLDPNALPAANGKLAMAPKSAAPAKPGAWTPPAPAAAPKEDPKLTQKDLPKTPEGPGGDLGNAMKQAVGADGKAVEAKPAAGDTQQFAPGSVPQKPSQGAVIGAIGAVLPQARACLGPDDPISRATVTFGSNGSVQSVNVTGHAAGKPAEACIKSALMKAKVAPFAEPQFAAPVTIRH